MIGYFRGMQFRQSILSMVLLLSYSLGFGHSLLPHCSNPDLFSHDHHLLHEHHDQSVEQDAHKTHIEHDNHKDEGLYDFLLCLLSDVDHHFHNELDMDFTFSKLSEYNFDFLKVELNAVQNHILLPSFHSSFYKTITVQTEVIYRSPHIGHLSHRGPPPIS